MDIGDGNQFVDSHTFRRRDKLESAIQRLHLAPVSIGMADKAVDVVELFGCGTLFGQITHPNMAAMNTRATTLPLSSQPPAHHPRAPVEDPLALVVGTVNDESPRATAKACALTNRSAATFASPLWRAADVCCGTESRTSVMGRG